MTLSIVQKTRSNPFSWRRRLQVPVRRSALCLFLATLSLAGCGGLTVTKVNSAEEKPNNVYVFFTVKDGDEPVGGLQASNFEIYEDDKLVSPFESMQVILNPEVAAVSYTLLLLDMSGSVKWSKSADKLVDAALSFKERVGKSQKVAVYAFDGAEEIHPVVPFTETAGQVERGLEQLRTYTPKDPSTNLHGAVVRGLETLKEGLDKDPKPLKFGTLVVFTDGTDRAARVSEDELRQSLVAPEYEHYETYAIGVGEEIDQKTLDLIGDEGSEKVADYEKMSEAFDNIAARIENHMRRFYLLSYCTPARKGEHRVKIKVSTGGEQEVTANWRAEADGEAAGRNEPGQEQPPATSSKDKKKAPRQKSGSVEYEFSADGFGPPPTCDPNRKPKFKLEAPLEPAEESDSKESTDAQGSSPKKSPDNNGKW